MSHAYSEFLTPFSKSLAECLDTVSWGARIWRGRRDMRQRSSRKESAMNLHHLAGAAYRALTFRKDGPSLYDVCDPLLLNGGGDPHLRKFYRTALGNPALRPLLRRAGLPELRDPCCLEALRHALMQARDEEAPDWSA